MIRSVQVSVICRSADPVGFVINQVQNEGE